MGFRFYRRIKIIPGVLNVSKSGVSTSHPCLSNRDGVLAGLRFCL